MIVPIFLPHLGCNKRCIYCNQHVITDLKSDDLKATINKSLAVRADRFEVGLFGGNIFGIEPFALTQLFNLFEDYKERISNFRCSTKPVPLRMETVEILKRNNVTVIELGIPSFKDRILADIGRDHTVEDLHRTYGVLEERGFQVALQVMVGLPGETMEDVRATADWLIRLKPHYVRIYPLVVLKETTLHEMYISGRFAPIPF